MESNASALAIFPFNALEMESNASALDFFGVQRFSFGFFWSPEKKLTCPRVIFNDFKKGLKKTFDSFARL